MTIFDEVRNEMKDDEIRAKREIKENIEKIRSLEFEDMGHVVWQLLSSGTVTIGSNDNENIQKKAKAYLDRWCAEHVHIMTEKESAEHILDMSTRIDPGFGQSIGEIEKWACNIM